MATIHISDLSASRDLSSLIERVKQGEEIVFKEGDREIAVLHAPMPPRRTIDECIALLPKDSPVIDEEFARDVAAAVEWHREPLDSSRWD